MEREGSPNKFLPEQSDDKKNKIVSSQVLEYYKKYSQNRELPRYFCGTSSFKIEDWHVTPVTQLGIVRDYTAVGVNTEEICEETIKPSTPQSEYEAETGAGARPALIGQDNLSEPLIIPDVTVVSDTACATSPASSLASNRRLEWDNGADIGYTNAETQTILHKSLSLPVLTTFEYTELQRNYLRRSPEGDNVPVTQTSRSSDLDLDTKPSVLSFKPPYSSSTSGSIKSSKADYVSSSSSTYLQQKHFSRDSDSGSTSSKSRKSSDRILDFVRGKVGLPIAESTPITRVSGDPKIRTCSDDTPHLIQLPNNFEAHRSNDSSLKNKSKDGLNVGQKLSNSCENLSSSKIEAQLKKWYSQLDINMVDQISHYKNMKVLKLCVSKPVVVECIGDSKRLVKENKFIQTSLPRHTSIAVQTDFDVTRRQTKGRGSPKHVENQSILYVCHSDSSNEQDIHSSATQTNSDMLSNCNSFEYLYGTEYDQNRQKLHQEIENAEQNKLLPNTLERAGASSTVEENDIALLSNLKKCPPKSDLTIVTPDSDKIVSSPGSQVTSNESPLAELLAHNQTKNVAPDLEDNFQMLKKLIQSEKYDDITKKYYLKKVINKIINYDYTADSLRNTKTHGDNNRNSNLKKSSVKGSNSRSSASESDESTSNKSSNAEKNTNVQNLYLHDNKPWLPIQPENSPNIKTTLPKELSGRKLQVQTFTSEILPTNNNHVDVPETSNPQERNLKSTDSNFVPVQVTGVENTKLKRSPLFTLTDYEHVLLKTSEEPHKHDNGDSSNSTANEIYEALLPPASVIVSPTESSSSKETISDVDRHRKIRSWREHKTRSEQVLELTSGDGDTSRPSEQESKDHLVRFARNERKHQLYWINSEISHLSKLKKLLEHEQKPKDGLVNTQHETVRTLQKPQVEDMVGSKKTTSVYIVTTEKNSGASSMHGNVCNPRICQGPCRHLSSLQSDRNGLGGMSTFAGKNGGIQDSTSRGQNQSRQSRLASFSAKNTDPVQFRACSCNSASSDKGHPIPQLTTSLKKPSLIGYAKTVVGADNETIDLQNARLVSSEQFTTDKNDKKCRTTVRRYTFEIPLQDSQTLNNKEDSQVELILPPKSFNQNGVVKSCQCCPEQCTCETLTTEPVKELTSGSNLESKETQTSKASVDLHSSSSGSSSASTSTGSSTSRLCQCCKQQDVKMCRTPKGETDNTKYMLCFPCYNQNLKANYAGTGTRPYYTFPGHVCLCYNNAYQAQVVQQMRNTLQDLDNLEKEEEYCKCMCEDNGLSSSGYCSRCKCKLKSNSPKGGLAYVVTFDSGAKKHKQDKKRSTLEETETKAPKSKNKPEDKYKKKEMPEASSNGGSEGSGKENSRKSKKHHGYENEQGKHRRKKSGKPTLQEYLCVNKPDFVASAEQRRQCLIDLAYMREERCQKYKQLLALTNGIQPKNIIVGDTKKPHIFSAKEMKQMTIKNYKKLPEVQQKLLNNKEKQIRKANKLLANIFNHNLRQQVLRGKHTLPTDASIINLV